MIDSGTLKEQFTRAFDNLAAEGVAVKGAELSHICFKFKSAASYAAYIEAACHLGTVTCEQFKGKEIAWCELYEPLHKDGMTLQFLELVEPKEEKNDFDGVTSIGYAIAGLPETVKRPSKDANVIYRYQSLHARDMRP